MLRRSSFALQNEQQAQVGQPTPASDEQSMSTPPGSPSSLTESNLVTLTPPSTISPRYRRNSIRHTSFVENIVYTQAPKSNPSVVSTPARTVNARRSTISSLSSLRNTMQDMFLDPPPDFALKDSPAKKSQLLFKANELANSLARDVATVNSHVASPCITTRIDVSRGRPSSCIFVASLAASRSDEQLRESVTNHFKGWGKLLSVKVLKDFMNRPYSFVQYTNDEDAKRALVEAQGTIVDGRHIRIERARVNRTLYIIKTNGRTTDEKEIESLLESFGELEEVVFPSEFKNSNRSQRKGCFVRFVYRDDAIKAFTHIRHNTTYGVQWAQNLDNEAINGIEKPEASFNQKSIFVGHLNAETVSNDKLESRFGVYGKIMECNLINKVSKNRTSQVAFAFIKYEKEAYATRAIEKENHSIFLERIIRVQYLEIHNRTTRDSALFEPKPAPPPILTNYCSPQTTIENGWNSKNGSPRDACRKPKIQNVYRYSSEFEHDGGPNMYSPYQQFPGNVQDHYGNPVLHNSYQHFEQAYTQPAYQPGQYFFFPSPHAFIPYPSGPIYDMSMHYNWAADSRGQPSALSGLERTEEGALHSEPWPTPEYGP